ncbi:MAG: ATP-dependent protease LonB [Candidatus Micrarchaeota archaeon]
MAKKNKAIAAGTTADVAVPKSLVEQVIGQEKAVDVIKKAARQKRNVLLIGSPGTGKSLLAQAMAELLPASQLEDILVASNPVDENRPKIKVVKTGDGRKLVDGERLKNAVPANNLNLLIMAFLFIAGFFLLSFGRQSLGDVITAALLIGLFVMTAMMMFASQVGRKGIFAMGGDAMKLLVDNAGNKKAPFVEATGSRAGALLGDVRHDPLQCIPGGECVVDALGNLTPVENIVDKYFAAGETGEKTLAGQDERVMGGTDGKFAIEPTRVFKVFKRKFEGNIVRIKTRSGCTLRVTPNHPLASLSPEGQVEYVPAGEINAARRVVIPERLPLKPGKGITRELSLFIADVLADGCLAQRRAESKLKREFKISQVTADINAIGIKPTVRQYAGATIVSANSAELARKLEGMGVREGRLKFVPPAIFEQPADAINAFVARIMSLDGYVNPQGQFELMSANKRYLLQIRALLFKSGVNAKYYTRLDRGFAKGKLQHILRWNSFEWAATYYENTINPFHQKNLSEYFATTHSGNECFDDVVPVDFTTLESARLRTGASKTAVHRDYYALNPSINRSNNLTRGLLQKIVQKLGEKLPQDAAVSALSTLAHGDYAFDEITAIELEPYDGFVYNLTTETGNYFVDFALTHNTGGLGTPAHLRVEAGAIHKANGGVLFVDEMATLSPRGQQELLTAMQEKKYAISGQSEMSSGALVHTEPVPCDFILVASGNAQDLRKMHPALRSRIRGYGYEVFMEENISDNAENRAKLYQFVAQEVIKDGKIPHFEAAAVEEIIAEARKRSGRKNKLTLKLRELGGLIRAAGDLAKERDHEAATIADVMDARKIALTLEQQVAHQTIELRKDYQIFSTRGASVGKVNGLAVMGDAGVILPIVAEFAPASSREEGRIITTGKLGSIAKEAVENVSAIIKKHLGKDTSSLDIHVQFLQTYEGVEGDSAAVSVATAVISAIEGVAVDQSVALTGSLSVRGEVLPVGGVTQKIEAAIDAGLKTVIIPKSNLGDIALPKRQLEKITIVPAASIWDVLQHALKDSKKKQALLSKIKLEFPA